ncbi:MAG: YesL family protein [Erysipelotrichaceae bacterium]|nr:YesL family protein [Erysipelotrichaceae bacterium]
MNYDSPFIKMLETIANMLIVSFLWVLFSLPVITITASCSALYHTTNKIIFGVGKGNGVFKDFFETYKQNLIPGIKLSLITVVAILFVLEGLWTGYQFYKVSIFGMLYFMLGILITFVVVPVIVYAPILLSRFDAPILSIIRMSAYFVLKKPLKAILIVILLAIMVLFVDVVPLALLIVPALYIDLIRGLVEKDMQAFIKEYELEEKTEPAVNEETEEITEAQSLADLDKKLSEGRKRGKR